MGKDNWLMMGDFHYDKLQFNAVIFGSIKSTEQDMDLRLEIGWITNSIHRLIKLFWKVTKFKPITYNVFFLTYFYSKKLILFVSQLPRYIFSRFPPAESELTENLAHNLLIFWATAF